MGVLLSLLVLAVGSTAAADVTRSAGTATGNAANVSVRRLAVPGGDPAEETVVLDPQTTALVMVDVWTVSDPVLLDNYHARLLPLLFAARELGFFIVHAPSESPLWPNITVLPGEKLVTGEDGHDGSASRCDGVLRSARGGRIKHVLLTGYDTNLCVIDKPCGAVSLSTELFGEAEVLLVRDTTRPGPDEYGNRWFSWSLSVDMIESGAWLPPGAGQQHVRSLVLPDLLRGFGRDAAAAALPTPQSPTYGLEQLYPGVRTTPLFEPFVHKNDHFAKTGSGRT
eukprot:COSAG06_NODE_15805_length_1041_cov_1.129237_1_plen_282_part_00